MKRVLVITYHFPPRPTVGSLRPLGLARYLPEFGWEAVILTAALPGKPDPHFNVIEPQYHDSLGFGKRLLKLDSQSPLIAQVKNKLKIKSEKSPLDFILAAIGEITAYPDPQRGWQRFAVEAGKDILRQQDIKALISSSPPVTSHIIAKRMKDEFKIPWVADFQDLWTQNYYYLYSSLRKVIERRLELNTISMADVLVAVSQPAADDLRSLHRQKPRLERLYTKVFGMDSEYSWDINDMSFQVWDDGITKREKGYYTHGGGGACSYKKVSFRRREVFSTFSGGRTALENVDFSLHAKNQGYYSIMEPSAKVFHKKTSQSKEKEISNRVERKPEPKVNVRLKRLENLTGIIKVLVGKRRLDNGTDCAREYFMGGWDGHRVVEKVFHLMRGLSPDTDVLRSNRKRGTDEH